MKTNTATEHLTQIPLSKEDFGRVKSLLHNYSGIFLHEGKEALVRARLMKRIRKVGVSSFLEYLDYVENDETGGEFLSLVDVLTTNKTSFFREKQHFDFLNEEVIPSMKGREFKWWSAGCSSGEEPVTMAMTLFEHREFMRDFKVKILATDLSRDVLRFAKDGIYTPEKVKDLPDYYLRKYFQNPPGGESGFQVKEQVQNLITYGRLNLQEKWPLKGPFQVIMCRNVMIYFNRQTQMELVSKFHDLLEPGGYLFLGHSESVSGKNHGFVNIKPAVYQKPGR
ncbi:protein-glutamate O-methyltransferase CheR [Rhodohalobacter sp. SW132]|uniref:CheR family methyltransferase n=1 Tax=Rhodohalobacter sp. SW132 TaxID=2293433 RepID=UPI000E284739|nr:protein-glutamate O-methyltransferase CheR [Rhodohalobacter sp. SW132]REL38705.1 protein-glutamate O-methyltransferase CheR [Rhodohalobacter sp. SW132]